MAFRQLKVLLELIRVKKTTMQQLAERFEVSTKTIARDIERLSASGFPVRCERGREGGVLIDPAFKLDKSVFTPSDISDIVLAMHLLAGIRGEQCAGGVLTKLAMAIPELTLETEDDLERYFYIDAPEGSQPDSVIFQTLNEALDEELLVSIRTNDQSLTAAPLGYVLRPSGLALYCYEDSCGYRLIDVAAITACDLTAREFDGEIIGSTPRAPVDDPTPAAAQSKQLISF